MLPQLPNRPLTPLPLLHHDLQSTSSVTTSASPSSSSTSSPQSSKLASPLSTNQHSNHDRETAPHFQSVRLPRCAVVNFRKDGDNLRWAPRVKHNSSGVSARVHNFEDAFSLEEFSSRALPEFYQPKSGNPRLSDISKATSDDGEQRIPARSTRSTPYKPRNPLPVPTRTQASVLQPMEKRAKSMGHSQRALVRTASVKTAVALATEVHRPSFWSLLAHTNKYQRAKAKARLENKASHRADTPRRPPVLRDVDVCENTGGALEVVVPRKPKAQFNAHMQKSGRGGKATKRAPEMFDKKNQSLFHKLLHHLDKRNNVKKSTYEDSSRGSSMEGSRVAFSKSGSTDGENKSVYGERSKRLFKQKQSEGHSSRRIVSALAGNLSVRKETRRRDLKRVASHDDQYVTFITSET